MLKKVFTALFLLSTLAIQAEEETSRPLPKQRPLRQISPQIDSYLKILHDHQCSLGPFGSWKRGEIEIVVNPEMIKKIENQARLRLISKGYKENDAATWSTVGVVAEDNYWLWIRDAVIYPSGVSGTYDRLCWKSGIDGPPGVAIFPLLPNKKIVVNLNYRHATRSWEIELPRGLTKPNETLEKAAKRELLEGTGYCLHKPALLGTMVPDSGVFASVIPLFFGEVKHSGECVKRYTAAISDNPIFTKSELKEGFARGYIEVPIKGNMIKANCRDPYLAYAILQAEAKGLL